MKQFLAQRRIVLLSLVLLAGLAAFAHVILPAPPRMLSLVMAIVYGTSAVGFALHWRHAGQRGDESESEDRFRLVFEHGGVGMALLSPEGDFVQVNPALVQMLGYPASELLGKHFTEVLYDQDRSGSNHAHQKADSSQYEREKRFVHRDGRIVWARIVRVPVRDAHGAIRYHAAIFSDVTQRKLAETALREERDFIAQLLQTTDAFILVVDPHGRILRFNNKCQRVSGHSEEAVRGRPFWECVLPERVVAPIRESFHQVFAAETTPARVVEFPWRTHAGEERLIAWRHSPVRDAQGRPRHVIGIGLDVTDQRRLEEQLARARKMETLGTLVGGIAHDFNNQLTAILGNLDMARGDLEKMRNANSMPNAECRMKNEEDSAFCILHSALEALLPCVLGAEQGAQRCASMTGRLLTFSRGRLGTMQPIALDQLVAETVRVLQHDAPDIRIEMEAPPDLWPVVADTAQLHELLLNLAANARDAMPHGGVLTLSLANRTFTAEDCAVNLEGRPGSFVELAVRDTGHGMTPEVREHLFEPFFTTKKGGTGMGLPVVFGIVKGHKGWIAVRSQPGEGAAFHIYLPMAEARVAKARPAPEPARTTEGYILVVDDEPIVRVLARTVLERWGFRVLTADSGEEALAIYRQQADRIALILLDYIMPCMNGVQVLKELQQINPEVGVVFSSGYSSDRDVDQLLATGARGFVPKPYRPRDLVQAIRQALAQEVVHE
jgi:two-component system, cell cycle sensor histidine kinase and response regulator CckA